ncbi:MAG: hypothetical protein OXN89_20880 [Bryobacterales bacterium]|nr:hypothetical protein [Bryobacterales bacterium]
MVRSAAIGRLLALAACTALFAGPLPAEDPTPAIVRLVRDCSRALQSGNAALFMGAFERRRYDRYQALREQITALTAQRRIASSVAAGPATGGPDEWHVSVDWLVELTPKLDPGPLERRRQTVVLRAAKRGGRWKFFDLEPLEFFAASRDD